MCKYLWAPLGVCASVYVDVKRIQSCVSEGVSTNALCM